MNKDMKDEIKDAIDEGAIISRDSDTRNYDFFHPSEIGDCTRKIYWKHKGVEGIPFEPRTIRIFDNGHKMHERMVDHLKKSESFNLVKEEFSVYDEKFRGQVDALGVINNVPVIIDFKSVGSYGFSLKLKGEVDKRYAWQAHVYMKLLGIKDFYLVYENKNDQNIHVVKVEYDEEIIKKIYEKAGNIQVYLDTDTLPDRDYKKTDWQCRYCQMREVCWKKEEEVKKNG